VGKQLRRIGEPVVAAPPAGVRVRTRLHLTEDEAAVLGEVGEYLGSVYRRELAHRISMGHLDRKAHAVWRAERKQAVTAVASSRWAGAITRAAQDQYRVGMRALSAQITDLRAAITVLEARCALRPGEVSAPPHGDAAGGPRRQSRRSVRGYASAAQRFSKSRRLAALRGRLAAAEVALAAGCPSITMGGNRLWRTRQNLAAAEMTVQQWRGRWDAARMFLTADGESGKTGGNETIRVNAHGQLRIKVPVALADRFGAHLRIAAPVVFNHRSDEWAERVRDRRAVRYDISYEPHRGRWYLDASWTITPAPIGEFDELRDGHVLGVDLNADHLAACVLDSSGNPVGAPVTIPVDTARLRATRRDGRVRAAITTLLDLAVHHNCTAVVVENLDFADARSAGRETLGRGRRGKRLRRTVAGIPTAKFRSRLTSMASRRGIAVIGVDPAYTSMWGRQHWRKPLQQQTSDPATVTVHHGAAAAIGRRGLGKPIRRRPTGPRTQQRMRAGTPPARPDQPPGTTRRCRSSGSPPRPQRRRGMPVHQRTPTVSSQHRSGRTRLTPAH
jgi:IS605 OrfB family transposase